MSSQGKPTPNPTAKLPEALELIQTQMEKSFIFHKEIFVPKDTYLDDAVLDAVNAIRTVMEVLKR